MAKGKAMLPAHLKLLSGMDGLLFWAEAKGGRRGPSLVAMLFLSNESESGMCGGEADGPLWMIRGFG